MIIKSFFGIILALWIFLGLVGMALSIILLPLTIILLPVWLLVTIIYISIF